MPASILRLGLPVLLAISLGACSWAPPQADHTGASRVDSVPASGPGQSARKASNNPVLLTARQMIGINYSYGGHSPDTGFDCSGLVYYAHRANGIDVPRTARALYDFSQPVDRDELRPGDLMFFRTSGKRVSHVGFYMGPGRLLHAPSTGKQVTVADYRTTYWRARYAGAGRVR